MFIPDLELCEYHSGAFDAKNWSAPLRAIGWLEHPNPFPTGVAPKELLPKLAEMLEQIHCAYPHYRFRGGMDCSLCGAAHHPFPGPSYFQENIFVPGSDVIYIAPGGIVHYVKTHAYLPPQEFIEAVLGCKDCRSREYREALVASNRGEEPPLRSAQSFNRWVSSFPSRRGSKL